MRRTRVGGLRRDRRVLRMALSRQERASLLELARDLREENPRLARAILRRRQWRRQRSSSSVDPRCTLGWFAIVSSAALVLFVAGPVGLALAVAANAMGTILLRRYIRDT